MRLAIEKGIDEVIVQRQCQEGVLSFWIKTC